MTIIQLVVCVSSVAREAKLREARKLMELINASDIYTNLPKVFIRMVLQLIYNLRPTIEKLGVFKHFNY